MKQEGILPSLPRHISESDDEFIRALVYNMEAAMHHDASQRPIAKTVMKSLTAAIKSKSYYHATATSGRTKIDFLLAGSATNDFKESLLAHRETIMPRNEHELCTKNEVLEVPPEIDKDSTSTTGQHGKLRGEYCPTLIGDPGQLKAFGVDRMVVGLRHPVLFFQDLYNHRVSNVHPRCNRKRQKQGSSLVQITERNQLEPISIKSVQFEKALIETTSSIKVFLYTSEQLDGGPSEPFRAKLGKFLGLSQSIEGMDQRDVHRGAAELNQKYIMDICERRFTGLRKRLLEQAKGTASFILEKFIAERNVEVGDLHQFRAIVTKWAKDPCPSVQKNLATNESTKKADDRIVAFDWSNIDFSQDGLCGGYKCFFYGNSDRIGYLVSRTVKKEKRRDVDEDIHHTWRVRQVNLSQICNFRCAFVRCAALIVFLIPPFSPSFSAFSACLFLFCIRHFI